ncbi:ferritin-like domain-containing protein [Chitinophaga nivalis]|uniref:Ferritin-like domain-containing protein n=1 Tax=Chitinophaga nivalis TaxID=2991709 RepID=A0ABT3IUZ8_9BACT|nr:ferritin-like domain-containing protein [Chitinophaga nivalis]MCW3462525.1 ferritin-like domain-containing protein [Chitinophaga nivalis]MCW3487784.1 ferritin-like domain-containing protein [Chitinophaga nivalis]
MDLMKTPSPEEGKKVMPGLHRRHFLKYLGAGASLAAIASFAACNKDDDNDNNIGDGVSLGSGDIAVLNYAYALEQLEAAFYTQVIASQFAGMTATEVSFFTDIRNHEIGHREFFKAALSGNAIPALEVDFSKVDFGKRDSVLATAKAFEDLGVSAYNGAGRFISATEAGKTYLGLAGKIVSVEARHAAYIRDLISNGSFANAEVIDANGLEMSKTPAQVFAIAGGFIKTKINTNTLPA